MQRRHLLGILANTFLGAAVGATVPIPKTAADGAEGGKLVWIQAAYEGEFKGYRFPIKLTAAVFGSLIKNLRRDPQFKAGPDGYGVQKVVRMDYEHASAMPPTQGSIPASGVPAPGWVCDLETRPGANGGPLELWALCSLGDQLREQIAKEEYRFTSIDAPLEAVDPVSGEKIGPKLRALAVTNDPFLRDLEPMRIAASMSQYGRAESPEELLIGLRQALELPDAATPQEVGAAVQALGAAFEADSRPPGFPEGLGCVLDAVRRLVGLPLLATADQIVEGAGQALSALSASTSTPPAPAPSGAPTMSNLSAKLSILFNCADDEALILAAATKASGGIAALDGLMATYGAKDPADLATKAAAARDAAGKAAEFATKLSEALAALDAGAEKEAANESETIAASMGFKKDDPRGVGARSLILSLGLAARRAELGIVAGPVGADGKPTLTLGAKDPSKLVEFRAQYPLPTAEQARAVLLTTPVVAGAGGAQLGGAHTGLTTRGVGAPSTGVPEHIAVLSNYAGADDFDRARAYLTDKQPGFARRSWHEQCFAVDRYLATGKAA